MVCWESCRAWHALAQQRTDHVMPPRYGQPTSVAIYRILYDLPRRIGCDHVRGIHAAQTPGEVAPCNQTVSVTYSRALDQFADWPRKVVVWTIAEADCTACSMLSLSQHAQHVATQERTMAAARASKFYQREWLDLLDPSVSREAWAKAWANTDSAFYDEEGDNVVTVEPV